MAIARVQSKTAATSVVAGSLNVVLNSAPTAGNLLVLACSYGGGGNFFLPNLGTGVNWVGRQGAGGNSVAGALYYTFVGASASATITLAFATGGSNASIAAVAAEYSGFSNPVFDQLAQATATSTAPASGATATTSTANELWIGVIGQRCTSPSTIFSSPTNSFSIVGEADSSSGTTNVDRACALLENIVSSTGTANAGATSSVNNNWVAIAGTFFDVTAGAGTTTAALRIPSFPTI